MFLRYSLMPLLCLTSVAAGAATSGAASSKHEMKLVSDEWALQPGPEEHELAVEGSLIFKLIRTKCYDYDGATMCYAARPTAEELQSISIEWQVNGIPLGSTQVGNIHSFTAEIGRAPTPGGEMERVIYTAPAKAPPGNPVAIAAIISTKGRTSQQQLVRHVRIVDTPGWRGNIQVNLFLSFDPEQLQGRWVEQPLFMSPWEFGITDIDRPVDHTVIESNLNYAVTGVLADAQNDDGSGVVMLQLRPSGTMNYYYRYHRWCDHKLHLAQGELAGAYATVPLNITVELKADGSSTLQYVPGVAFDMHGERIEAVCSVNGREKYDGFAEAYEDFFEGATITSELVHAGGGNGPTGEVFRGIDGKGGDGHSYTGSLKVPISIRYGGKDYIADAEITWSLSRR